MASEFGVKAVPVVGVRSTYAKENILSHKEIRCSTEASQSAESSTREMARCRRHVTLIWLLGLPAERPMSLGMWHRCLV